MRPELRSELAAIARGDFSQKYSVTTVTPVTAAPITGHNSLKLLQLPVLLVKIDKAGNDENRPVTVTIPSQPDEIEFEERKAMAMGAVPERYLDGSRLQLQRPAGVDEARWQQAVNDAGWFLDRWGAQADAFGFTAGDLFEAPSGLVWFSRAAMLWHLAEAWPNARTGAFGRSMAQCQDGRIWRKAASDRN
jgi:hypothetical protein